MTIWNFDWVYFWETANYISWYEWLALLCFGFGWWFSVKNSRKTKQIAGKSFLFLWLVISGCVCGICHHLFIDLNFKIILYLVVLCGAASDYYVCRRLRLEQDIKERKKVIAERDWSYGSDASKKANNKHGHKSSGNGEHGHKSSGNGEHSHKSSDGDGRRHGEHKGSSHKHSTREVQTERLNDEKRVDAGSKIEEIEFDDISE